MILIVCLFDNTLPIPTLEYKEVEHQIEIKSKTSCILQGQKLGVVDLQLCIPEGNILVIPKALK